MEHSYHSYLIIYWRLCDYLTEHDCGVAEKTKDFKIGLNIVEKSV